MVAYGWPAMFVIPGAIGLLGLLGWLRDLLLEPENHPWLKSEDLDYIGAASLRGEAGPDGLKLRRKDRGSRFSPYKTTWIMMIGGFCLQYVLWFYISWLPTYLQKSPGHHDQPRGNRGGHSLHCGRHRGDDWRPSPRCPRASRLSSTWWHDASCLAASAVLTGLAMFGTALCSTPTVDRHAHCRHVRV